MTSVTNLDMAIQLLRWALWEGLHRDQAITNLGKDVTIHVSSSYVIVSLVINGPSHLLVVSG
jgi:hypothetical protein